MILRQFLHTDPIGISYLFGCGGKAAGAVVDPVGDIQFYLRAAETAGMRIHFVIDTHVHADHRSVGRALEKRRAPRMSSQRRRMLRSRSKACATKRFSRLATSWRRCCTRPATRRSISVSW